MRSFLSCCLLAMLLTPIMGQPKTFLSHPPLRIAPEPEKRPRNAGPGYFVSAKIGDNENDGSEKHPWKTINHALQQLKAGDTLYLREGTYYEQIYLALVGTEKSPITIRAYPGEHAIVDGGWQEFFSSPETSWEPVGDHYRSRKTYKNIRNVIGSFGDSMIGLQTYYHKQDFLSKGEFVDWQDWDNRDKTDLKPIYLGPGLWYDHSSGHIHARLAHTHLPKPATNYRGVTDPRKVPMVLSPFNALPLMIDRAKHIRLQDITIRGGGYHTIKMAQAVDIVEDNVTVWCGTYGISSFGTGPFRFTHSGLYGNVAPWTFRGDGSKRDYPGRPHRNISRLNTHALLVIDSGRESSVYATPYNDFWEIDHSEFTDAHDALYLGAINLKFHHNLIENMQDDGIYLSPMYYRHRLEKTDPQLYIYQNVFRQQLTALAFGGPQPYSRDTVYIFRNLFDLRQPVPTGRPSAKRAEPGFSYGRILGDHGSPPWSNMRIYHNTFIQRGPARYADMETNGHTAAKLGREVFNNIFYHSARLPGFIGPNTEDKAVSDGNLYWSPTAKAGQKTTLFSRFRKSTKFTASKSLYPAGSTTHSIVVDPKFVSVQENAERNDYRLGKNSPALNSGVAIPKDWPDPIRKADAGQPDLGALPLGVKMWKVGR